MESNELSVTTMDTTSHNFTWQTFTFDKHSSSVLNEVAIIDENNIWAVGKDTKRDGFGCYDVFGVTEQFNSQKKMFCAISNVFKEIKTLRKDK